MTPDRIAEARRLLKAVAEDAEDASLMLDVCAPDLLTEALDRIEGLETVVKSMNAELMRRGPEITRLREALEPLAKLYDSCLDDKPNDHPVWRLNSNLITVGDIRAALETTE